MTPSIKRIVFGIPFLIIGLVLLVALISYNPMDPSFNKATSEVATNLAGNSGACIADLLMLMLGYASYVLPIFLIINSYRALMGKPTTLLSFKIGLLIISLPLLAASFASFYETMHQMETVGGYMGAVLSSEINIILSFSYWGAVGITLSLILIFYSVSISLVNLAQILHFFKAFISRGSDFIEEAKILPNLKPTFFNKKDQNHPAKIAEIVNKPKPLQAKAKIQPSLKLESSDYELPATTLLKPNSDLKRQTISESALSQNSRMLQQVLEDFGIRGEMLKIHPGPVVTLYEFEPAAGVKSSRVIGLADDIARSMSSVSARISIISGKSSLGIELPNAHREIVLLRELIESNIYESSDFSLPLVLGKTIGGEPIVADLAKMPHLLVAGTTGSGKSVAINTMILSLLYKYSPKTCKFIMIDPKMLELSIYDGIPHLLAPVVTEPKKAVAALKWVVKEMENRYRMMSTAGVRNIDGYNREILEAAKRGVKFERQVQVGFDGETGKPKYETITLDSEPLPFIVVIVDEMADLMIVAGKEIEGSIQRLAQMARAAGIHIIMATQRPSVDVITGVIKANFPTRISFQVTSKIDSRTILGEPGAEQLLGMGDMLFMRGGGRIERVHGPYVNDKEIEAITSFIKAQGAPVYIESVTHVEDEDGGFDLDNSEGGSDDLYNQALAIILRDRKASTSYIQRCLRIGYNRAASIIERMEREGVVSSPNHVGKREVILGENNN